MNATSQSAEPTLADLIQRALDKGLTYRELEERSRGAVKAQTFNAIVLGKHSLRFRDQAATARGIATALGEPLSQVEAAMNMASSGLPPIAWPERFNSLSPARRKLAFQLLDDMLTAQKAAQQPEDPLSD